MDIASETPTPRSAERFAPPTEKPLRIALVISGAVSLGSYEAGALTGLLKLVQGSEGQIIIDTIVGASAGSISGLLLAHALLTGVGSEDEQTLWVEETDLDLLLKGKTTSDRPRAPLSPSLLVEWARARLHSQGGAPLQRERIYLVLSVANLQGLSYRMAIRDEAIRADTYRDAATFVLEPDCPQSIWDEAMKAAVASSAHAFAFSAVRLNRTADDYPPEIDWPAGANGFWYTDGGTVYNEPLGMALDALYSPVDVHLPDREGLGEADRVILLIHPHPDDPLSAWPPGGGQPVFGQSSLRAFNMQRSQSLYQDLQTLEKYNGRLYWRRRLQEEMQRAELENAEWIRRLAKEADEDRRRRHHLTKPGMTSASREPEPSRAGSEAHRPSSIDVILDAATGTAGKRPAWVEVVSPDIDPRVASREKRIAELLAGERLGHFLGFADVRARRSDFRLGYENFQRWWEGSDSGQGFRDRCDFASLGIPDRDWSGWNEFGDFSLADVSWKKRFAWGLRLLWRYYREIRALRTRLHQRT